MEDSQIVELYWKRLESAISETAEKYGRYCYRIAYNILTNAEDAEESVNDTYFSTWNALPPQRPDVLSAFLGKITRRISIDRWRRRTAEKRGGSATALVLDELEDCVASGQSVEREAEEHELVEAINTFLSGLSTDARNVFVCRYFFMASIKEICEGFGYSQSKTKSMLSRTRRSLRAYLEKEGLL